MIQEFHQNTALMRPAYLGSKDIYRLIALVGIRRSTLSEKQKDDDEYVRKYFDELGDAYGKQQKGHFDPAPEWILKNLVDLEYKNKNMGEMGIKFTDDVIGRKKRLPEEVIAQFEHIHKTDITCSGAALFERSIFTKAERKEFEKHLFDNENQLHSCGRIYCEQLSQHFSSTGLTMKEQEFACKI
jgi:hypothetical protein